MLCAHLRVCDGLQTQPFTYWGSNNYDRDLPTYFECVQERTFLKGDENSARTLGRQRNSNSTTQSMPLGRPYTALSGKRKEDITTSSLPASQEPFILSTFLELNEHARDHPLTGGV